MATVTNKEKNPKQLPLLDKPEKVALLEPSFKDPAFAGNKNLPIHRWVPWIAGFSSEFVKGVLRQNLLHEGTVLDPFSGVGTTLVEAVLHGHKAIGFEINPYAKLACDTKLKAYLVDTKQFSQLIKNFESFYSSKVLSGYSPKSSMPSGFKTRGEFYSPDVLKKVLILQDFINSVADSGIKNVFRLAFASTMVQYSNYSYEPSLGQRISSGKSEILDFDIEKVVVKKLNEMLQDILWYREHLPEKKVEAKIYNKSFFGNSELKANAVDLIITSPPYLNNYHYNRNTRPQLYWLGCVQNTQDMKKLEEANFGKYWQTVRDGKDIKLDFALPNTDLEAKLDELKETRKDKGLYGGRGWTNYAAVYFNDCYKFCSIMKKILKPGGKAFVVIGNSILQGIFIPTDVYLGKIAEKTGLELTRIEVVRKARIGNSIINSEFRFGNGNGNGQHTLYEAIVEITKPKVSRKTC